MSAINPATKPANQELTIQEKLFLEWYFIMWNGGKAAVKAGYCLEHPVNARQAAYEILNKPYIKAAIDDRVKAICMEANEVLARLAAIARGDILDFMSQDAESGEWYVDLVKARDSGLSFIIKSYTVTREGPQIELYSAMEALDKIAKHLNLLKQPDTEINVSLTAWAQFVQQAKDERGVDLNAPLRVKSTGNTHQELDNAIEGRFYDPATSAADLAAIARQGPSGVDTDSSVDAGQAESAEDDDDE